MTSIKESGYGVCRTVSDAREIVATAKREGLRGCYPSAAVVLEDALNRSEEEGLSQINKAINFVIDVCEPQEGIEFLRMWRESLHSEISEAWPAYEEFN